MQIDLASFFSSVRASLFGGRLTTKQVAGMEAIISAFVLYREKHQRGGADVRWLAYCLGTAFLETAQTMQPIVERGGRGYFFRMYDPGSPLPERAALARRTGALPGDGEIFYGRGYVQLTWRENYVKASAALGMDLVSNPDEALQPGTAAAIMLLGMDRGMFTGKKLADYFNTTTTDWKNARRIINGLDRADDVASYARNFLSALEE